MANIIGVRFKEVGKVYYFDPIGINFNVGDDVIVETSRGVECGKVAMANRELSNDKVNAPLKKIIRKATENDLKIVEENHKKEKKAFGICEQKIHNHNLQMKLVNHQW